MTSKNCLFEWLIFGIFVCSTHASPPRISSISLNKAKVSQVKIAPGLACLVIFNCEIEEALSGRPESLSVKISPKSKKELILLLQSSASNPTNVIVRCSGASNPMVFDVIPNSSDHQDVLKVSTSFGAPEFNQKSATLIESSDGLNHKKSQTVIEVSPPKLIEKGEVH